MNVTEFGEVIKLVEPLVQNVTDSAVLIAGLYIGFNLLIELLVPVLTILALYKSVVHFKEWAVKRKVTINEQVTRVNLDGKIISTDPEVAKNILEAFNVCRNGVHKGGFVSEYMHKQDSELLLQAVKEKLERDHGKTTE
ncbi:hypothetical protein [Vibrio phage Artemius]|nr:hypothetical protein [Vibrio phage Artemius]